MTEIEQKFIVLPTIAYNIFSIIRDNFEGLSENKQRIGSTEIMEFVNEELCEQGETEISQTSFSIALNVLESMGLLRLLPSESNHGKRSIKYYQLDFSILKDTEIFEVKVGLRHPDPLAAYLKSRDDKKNPPPDPKDDDDEKDEEEEEVPSRVLPAGQYLYITLPGAYQPDGFEILIENGQVLGIENFSGSAMASALKFMFFEGDHFNACFTEDGGVTLTMCGIIECTLDGEEMLEDEAYVIDSSCAHSLTIGKVEYVVQARGNERYLPEVADHAECAA